MEQRMKKELLTLSKLGDDSLIGVIDPSVAKNPPRTYTGWIKGPDDTPYEDGVYLVEIALPDNYPFSPPKMKFITKLWHPNVSSVTGAICLDTLKGEWTPALTIRTALLSILALFTAANPTDPQDHVVAKQYLEDSAAFAKQAREWAEKYGAENIALYKGPRYKTTKGTSSSPSAIASPTKPAAPVDNTPFKYQLELNQLVEMGFDPRQSRQVLEQTKGDLDQALIKFQTL